MKTQIVTIGNKKIGGRKTICIQSMTDTDTCDVEATVKQILELEKAGSEMVRITVDNPKSSMAVPEIIKRVREKSAVPIIGDFHYQGHILLEKFPEMAKILDKWRINPGNVGKSGNKGKRDTNFETIILLAKKYNKPIRIGVNGGSLDQDLLTEEMEKNNSNNQDQNQNKTKTSDEVFIDAMVKSALLSAQKAEELGLEKHKIVLSVKHSNVNMMIRAYESLSKQCDYALHLGLTEAGGGINGVVSSSIALGILLKQNIGNTIRVSITPQQGESRTKEVLVAKSILQALEIRMFAPKIISCPGCGRTTGNKFSRLAENIEKYITQNNERLSTFPLFTKLTIAVMGCIVNGEGEAKHADIGIFFPGKGEGENAVIYTKSEKKIVHGSREEIEEIFIEEIEKHITVEA